MKLNGEKLENGEKPENMEEVSSPGDEIIIRKKRKSAHSNSSVENYEIEPTQI